MQVDRRTVDRDFPVHEPAQRRRQRRNIFGEHAGIRDDGDVGRKLVAIAVDRRLKIRRADLFFTFKTYLDVDRQASARSHMRFDRGQMHQRLALVVHRTAAVDLSIADRRFERRRAPQFDRVDRLHVVVAVDQ